MRIVLADPSRAVHRAMTQLIAEGGHEVVAFADGREALARIAEDEHVRALITSTQPLNMTGIELCAAARKLSGARRALHVILMSSTEDYYLAVTALDNGADDFIHKPPIPDELRARLRLADRVTAMKQQLIHHATTDPLTNLLNRRAFFEGAAAMCRAAEDGKSALSAIMFDLDHFKKINDTFGHEMGDTVLAEVGARTRATDGLAGRLGGEEFCVLGSGELADAWDRARELQRSLKALRFTHNGEAFGITCFGIAEWEPGDVIDRMLRRADVAMYESKKTGRDRITAADTFVATMDHDEWHGAIRMNSSRT
jgi:two-component system, cell cycle response regulator